MEAFGSKSFNKGFRVKPWLKGLSVNPLIEAFDIKSYDRRFYIFSERGRNWEWGIAFNTYMY